MKSILKIFTVAIIAFSVTLTGCSGQADRALRKKVVAEVNGEKILMGELLDAYNEQKSYYDITDEVEGAEENKELIVNFKKGILEDLIYQKLISQNLVKEGLKVTDEISKKAEEEFNSIVASIEEQMKASEGGGTEGTDYTKKAKEYVKGKLDEMGKTEKEYIKMIGEQLITQQLMEKAVGEVQASDEEIKAFYDDQLKAEREGGFTASEELDLYSEPGVRVKHILIGLPEAEQQEYSNLVSAQKTDEAKKYLAEKLKGIYPKAKEVLDKVKNGGDFEKLLAEYGEDPGMQGNEEGYTVKADGQFIPEFEKASLSLAEGKVTDLVGGPFGYHIIKAYEVMKEKVSTLEENTDKIKQLLVAQKKEEKWSNTLQEWMEKGTITRYEDLI